MQRSKTIESEIVLCYTVKEVRTMKDFPVFTTEYGVASLILREIPYRQEAYIIIHSSEMPEELLAECCSFCRMCGAEVIYARGHDCLNPYPIQSSILSMQGELIPEESEIGALWPVTCESIGKWRQMMNERMSGVDHAATLDRLREKEILDSAGAYFIHQDGELLGAGWLMADELMAVAAFRKGMGELVLRTLLSTVPDRTIRLQVASTNIPAIRLYERLGFVRIGAEEMWHRVYPYDPIQLTQKI